MRGTRWTRLVCGSAVLVAVVAPQPAGAVTDVTMVAGGGTIVDVSLDCCRAEERVRFLLEHFADGTRNGVRIRQLSIGDPTITNRVGDCDWNPAFNDVVCTPIPAGGRVFTGSFDDEVVLGGSNIGCETTAGTPFQVSLGAGNDILRVSEACGGQTNPAGRHRIHPRFVADCCERNTNGVEGGSGHDDISGGSLDDELHGDSGNDTIDGGSGDDNLDGGFDHDEIFGGSGTDTLLGSSGNDTLRGESGGDTLVEGGGTDLLNGSTGVDTASYNGRLGANLTITLDGIANDGAAGENDDLVAIENVIGGFNPDRITGNGGPNDLRGREGNDTIEGGGGNDELEGGAGTDVLKGEADDDTIDSRDAVQETVNCGTGIDHAEVDLADTFAFTGTKPNAVNTCESFTRFAVDDGRPGRIRGRSVRIRRSGRLKLRLRCPRRARVTCKGKLRLKHVGKRRTLALRRYKVRRGKTKTIRLKLSRRAARRARERKAIVVRTRERGVSKKSRFRGSVVRLRVRR